MVLGYIPCLITSYCCSSSLRSLNTLNLHQFYQVEILLRSRLYIYQFQAFILVNLLKQEQLLDPETKIYGDLTELAGHLATAEAGTL